jgi:hypothetical protein
MLVIALAALWLVLAAFVLTMCRVAARSDGARAAGDGGDTPHSRPRRAQPISRGPSPAQRRQRRSRLGVE